MVPFDLLALYRDRCKQLGLPPTEGDYGERVESEEGSIPDLKETILFPAAKGQHVFTADEAEAIAVVVKKMKEIGWL